MKVQIVIAVSTQRGSGLGVQRLAVPLISVVLYFVSVDVELTLDLFVLRFAVKGYFDWRPKISS